MENALFKKKHKLEMSNNVNEKNNLDILKGDQQTEGRLRDKDLYAEKTDVINSEFTFDYLKNKKDDQFSKKDNFPAQFTKSYDERVLEDQSALSSPKKENNFNNHRQLKSLNKKLFKTNNALKETDNDKKITQNNGYFENSENEVKNEASNDNESSQDRNKDKEPRQNSDGVVMLDGQLCKVCGDSSVSSLFGSVVCVPCKTFFLRYGLDCKNFKCKASGNCVITPQNRTKCKYCRYKKCSEIGMWKKARTSEVMMKEGQHACVVCSDLANGVHFGAVTCEGCKKFFRRGLTEHSSYACKQFKSCEINPQTRNACRYCRYQKCLKVGMSREAIKMGRPSKSKTDLRKLLKNCNYVESVIEDAEKSTNNDTKNSFEGSGLNEHLKKDHLSFDSKEQTSLRKVDRETDYKSDAENKLTKNVKTYNDIDNPIEMLNNESIPDVESAKNAKSDGFDMKKNLFNPVGSTTDLNTVSAGCYKNIEKLAFTTEEFTNIENNIYPPSVQSYNSPSRMLCGQNSYNHENDFNSENKFNKKLPYAFSRFQNDQLTIPNNFHYNLAFSRNYVKPYPYIAKYPYDNYNKTAYYGNKRANAIKNIDARNFSDVSVNLHTNFDKMNFINHKEKNNHNTGIFNKNEKSIYDPVNNNTIFQRNENNFSGFISDYLSKNGRSTHFYERSFSPSTKNNDFNDFKNTENLILNNNNNNLMVNDFSQNRSFLENNQENIRNQEMFDETNQKQFCENTSMIKPKFEYIEEKKDLLDKKFSEQLRQQQSSSCKKLPRRLSHMSSLNSIKTLKAEDSQLSSSDDFEINLFSSSQPKSSDKTSNFGLTSSQIFERLQKKAFLDESQDLCTTTPASKLSNVSSSFSLAQFQKLSQLLPSLGDRSSPYNPIMSLLTSCSLFNEASKNPFMPSNNQSQTKSKVAYLIENIKEDSSTDKGDGSNSCLNLENSSKFLLPSNKFKKNSSILKFLGLKEELRNKLIEEYWLTYDQLPDESLMLTTKHFSCICNIIKAYKKFLECGSNINATLKKELELWNQQSQVPLQGSISLPEWIQVKVIPVYTFSSLIYCKCLPGFTELPQADQATLIRLGQTQSRILLAAIHWFNPQKGAFDDFLSWRPMDLFKKSLLSYAKKIQLLQLDFIEAALLNALLILAADYPGLENPSKVNDLRQNILIPFRAYTTAKFGTPNKRLEDIFTHVPETRKLGYLHYQMTMKTSLKAEEVEKCSEWQEY